MIPYSRLTLSDFSTLSQTILLEYHTLHGGTYLYSPYIEVATSVVRALSIVKLGQKTGRRGVIGDGKRSENFTADRTSRLCLL